MIFVEENGEGPGVRLRKVPQRADLLRWIIISSAILAGLTAYARPQESIVTKTADPREGSPGRYQIVISTLAARDTYLLDTATGRVWQAVGSKSGESVWQEMRKTYLK